MHSNNHKNIIKTFNEFLTIRDLAKNTIASYNSFLRCYLSWVDTELKIPAEDVSSEQIRKFILYLKKIKKLSNRSINAYISQIKFLQLYVIKRPCSKYDVPYMKFNTYLPNILTKEEVTKFISTIKNLKHKACIALLYSSGLRVSELCHLRYDDIDRKNMRIYVSCSKTRSDRYAILSSKALTILTEYWYAFNQPKQWLFPGTKPDSPIVSFTVSRFLADHASSISWDCKPTAHMMRHSFGTHLYEEGVDLLIIQKLLGHKSINSTTIYINLARDFSSKYKSPFDTEVEK